MYSARWITFGIRSALTNTVVHFFPLAEKVRAPYPVVCKFRVFGSGEASPLIAVEGARLGQPDGIKLSQVFKDVPESNGLYGLEIILASQQSRVNLGPSRCIVEIASTAGSCRFRPRRINASRTGEETELWDLAPAVAVKDAYHSTSLVVVNMAAESITIPSAGKNPAASVAPGFVSEHVYGDQGFAGLEPGSVSPEGCMTTECSWGLLRSFPVRFQEGFPGESAAYLLYRDSATRVPHSIVAL